MLPEGRGLFPLRLNGVTANPAGTRAKLHQQSTGTTRGALELKKKSSEKVWGFEPGNSPDF